MGGRKKGRGSKRSGLRQSSSHKAKKESLHIPVETGAIIKPRGNRITIALCYPNSYAVAMGNLGFHQVYHLFNEYDDVACERAVLSPDGGRPLTIESGRSLRDFEIIAFSISYETDVPNMAVMLHRAGVPLYPDQRERENAPLVLAGGVVAFMNPEPLAPLVDVIVVGEAEVLIPDLLEAYRKERREHRVDLLAAMARVQGIYVPSLYDIKYAPEGLIESRSPLTADAPRTVTRRFSPDLSVDPACTRVFTDRAEFCDMALIEMSRGCVHGCRFCAGAYIYRPPRWTPMDSMEKVLSKILKERNKAGLIAASATDHPSFNQLRSWIREQGKLHSVASLRLDQVTPELLSDIKACGHKTLTVAPEAGTERMRLIINKPVTDKKIESAMEMVGASGIPRLKLYFQVGLPFETSEDIKAIPELVVMIKKALAVGAGKKWGGAISISINPFVPKPGTPFQWHCMFPLNDLRKKLDFLRRSLKKLGGVNVSGTSTREAMLQGVIGRGDRRTGLAIIEGTMSGESPMASLRAKSSGLPPPGWYLHREREMDEIMPWDFIDHGVSKSVLWGEYQKAEKGKTTPPCRPGRCKLCDACDEFVLVS